MPSPVEVGTDESADEGSIERIFNDRSRVNIEGINSGSPKNPAIIPIDVYTFFFPNQFNPEISGVCGTSSIPIDAFSPEVVFP